MVVLSLIYILFYIVCSVISSCNFPSYLQTDAYDHWTITRPEVQMTIRVEGNLLSAWSSLVDHSIEHLLYERKCEDSQDDQKFLVSERSRNVPISYLCLQFHVRGYNVVQIKESNSSTYKRKYMCKDENLILNNWPLLSTRYLGVHARNVPCPLVGGFDMTVYNNQDGTIKCNERLPPLRLESECRMSEGMEFYFRYADCVNPDWGIDYKQQKASCIAFWQEKDYTFMAVRPKIQHNTKVWCIRVKFGIDTHWVHIFFDFVCDTSYDITQTENYVNIELRKRIFRKPCTDVYKDCAGDQNVCTSEEALNCPESCGKCNQFVECLINDAFRGQWRLISKKHKRNILIESSTIAISDLGQYKCENIQAAEFMNRQVLLQLFDNGCYPRYSCIDLIKIPHSPSVIKYRLGNHVQWPVFHVDHLKQYICGNNRFDDAETFQKQSKFLIKVRKLQFVHCKIPFYKSGYLEIYDSKRNCSGYLEHNIRHRMRQIDTVFYNCSGRHKYVSKKYHCISHEKRDFYSILLTKSKNGKNSYLCWIFPIKGEIYILFPEDCNEDVIRNIQLGNIYHIHTWKVSEKRKEYFLGSRLSKRTKNKPFKPISNRNYVKNDRIFPYRRNLTGQSTKVLIDYWLSNKDTENSGNDAKCLRIIAFMFIIHTINAILDVL